MVIQISFQNTIYNRIEIILLNSDHLKLYLTSAKVIVSHFPDILGSVICVFFAPFLHTPPLENPLYPLHFINNNKKYVEPQNLTLNNKIIDFPTCQPRYLMWIQFIRDSNAIWMKNNHHYSTFTITTETNIKKKRRRNTQCVDRRRSKRYHNKHFDSGDIEIQFYPIKIDLKV